MTSTNIIYGEYHIKYPMRTQRKVATMYKIYSVLPATFKVIRDRTKEHIRSETTIYYRLKDMLEMGIIKKDYNLYEKNPEFIQFMEELAWDNITSQQKFAIKVLALMKYKLLRKRPGKKPELIETSTWDLLPNEIKEKFKKPTTTET